MEAQDQSMEDPYQEETREGVGPNISSLVLPAMEEEPKRRNSLVKSFKTRVQRHLKKAEQRRHLRRGNIANSLPTPVSPIPEYGENSDAYDSDFNSNGTSALSEDCSTGSSLTGYDDYLYVEGEEEGAGAGGFRNSKNKKPVNVVTPTRGNRRRSAGTSSSHGKMGPYQQPESFPDAAAQWLDAAEAVWQSPELAALTVSTCHAVGQAGNLAVRTACLPVTLPLHVCFRTTEFFIGSCLHVVGTVAGTLIGMDDTIQGGKDDAHDDDPLNQAHAEQERHLQSHNSNLILDILGGVFGAPGFMLGVAGKIKDDLGSVALQVVAPVLGMEPQYDQADCAKCQDDDAVFLDRLRLDYVAALPTLKTTTSTTGAHVSLSIETNSLSRSVHHVSQPLHVTSVYLLRVDDLGVTKAEADPVVLGKENAIFYIDLSPKHSNKKELAQSLDRLVACGLSLVSNHPTVRLTKQYERSADMEWYPEGSTKKLLRKMANLPSIERLKLLEKDHLIWSGKFKNERRAYGGDYAFFLARGIIHMSPRDFLTLLWDNRRTDEYNNFSLGRETVLEIDDNVLAGAVQGTKVIKGETRVPFTGKSVHVSCLMHVRPLEGPDEGFVIASRSLDSGLAGTHVGSRDKVENDRKSEILWGVNVIRCVPNNPQLTDLTSLSQVGSPMVPKFLAQRIGVMGVDDFYKNVRDTSKRESLKRSETG